MDCSSGCVSSSDERCAGCAEPNIGNGHDHETYSWTQTLADLSLNVPVPPGTKGRGCDVTITKNRLKVSSRSCMCCCGQRRRAWDVQGPHCVQDRMLLASSCRRKPRGGQPCWHLHAPVPY